VNNFVGLESFLFYLIQYSLTSLNIFLILIAYGYIVYLYQINLNNSNKISSPDVQYISQLLGFFKSNSILATSFIITLFSVAGIPPLPGFFAKQKVLLAGLSLGFIFITIIAILTSVVSASYYLKLINSTVLQEAEFFTLKNKIKDLIITNNKSNKNVESGSFFSKNTNLTEGFNPANYLFGLKFSALHSYIISILTLSILFFLIKPELLFNAVSICTLYLFIF
jgi:NADH-ubiquinone oxidoreductase chain 2